MTNRNEEILNRISNSWENVYWFARILINNDKYVPIGKDPKFTAQLAGALRVIEKEVNLTERLTIQKNSLFNLIRERFKKSIALSERVENLIKELDKLINTIEDIHAFILTCENILIPINQAIQNIPNNDLEFTLSIAKSFLDVQGDGGLATVITLWDTLGVKGCLTVERAEVIRAFATLRGTLKRVYKLNLADQDTILTAFVQEFERRVAQKRKKRAGGSLENVTNFILDYYNIPQTRAPEHFQADIEVDNWIKVKGNWLIGISCKRTLRERWKQVSSAHSVVLSQFKIKYIFHILTFDEDLSDDKLALLGAQRHIFYLPDSSRRLNYALNDIGLKDYVRPISEFVKDIKKHF